MFNNPLTQEAHRHALDLLGRSITPQGIMTRPVKNKKEVVLSAREGVMAGLAGVVSHKAPLLEGLRNTLECLANHQGPNGEIPDHIHYGPDGEISELNYGKRAGRVESISWFVIGLCHYIDASGEKSLGKSLLPQVQKALQLLNAWEFNSGGLVHVPQAGGWADEFILSGYTLYDQLLRIWALRCAGKYWPGQGWHAQAADIVQLVRDNFWPNPEHKKDSAIYHPQAYRSSLKRNNGEPVYWLAALSPGGYLHKFDLMANALVLLLHVHTEAQLEPLLAFTGRISKMQPGKLLPCFWPPVYPEDPEWHMLSINHSGKFRNKPFQYQNAGIWTFCNAWWGLALSEAGENLKAKVLFSLMKTIQAGKEAWGFYEYLDAKKGKVSGASHSCAAAAGWLLLYYSMQNENLNFN